MSRILVAIHSRSSGENFVCLFIPPSSQRLEPPHNPGWFKQTSMAKKGKSYNWQSVKKVIYNLISVKVYQSKFLSVTIN